jgi:methylisocitrate lyase
MKQDEIVVCVGAQTPLFARLIEEAGFKCISFTGAGVANMNFCLPDYALTTMTENYDILRRLNDATNLPLNVDLDDGYGGGLNVYRTIREVSRLDVGSVVVEDQQHPKRCGHFEDHAIISKEAMCKKIKAAKDASLDPDLFLLIRTDAVSATGSFETALERAHAYVEAGADGIFIEAPTSIEQMKRIPKEFSVPTFINQVEHGKTPQLTVKEFQDMGFKIVCYANATLKASIFGVNNLLAYLKEKGTTVGAENKLMITSDERHRLTEKTKYQEMLKLYN